MSEDGGEVGSNALYEYTVVILQLAPRVLERVNDLLQ